MYGSIRLLSLPLAHLHIILTQVSTMTYPIDKATYDKVDTYHLEFRTGSLTSMHVPKIIDHYSLDMEPEMVLKGIIVGNACAWASYKMAHGHYERYKEAFKF